MNTFEHIRFRDWICKLSVMWYHNNRPALRLLDAKTGEPIAMATINLDDVPTFDPHIEKGLIFIKNYAENDGLLQALVQAGVVHYVESRELNQFVNYEVCTLTDEAEEFVYNKETRECLTTKRI